MDRLPVMASDLAKGASASLCGVSKTEEKTEQRQTVASSSNNKGGILRERRGGGRLAHVKVQLLKEADPELQPNLL